MFDLFVDSVHDFRDRISARGSACVNRVRLRMGLDGQVAIVPQEERLALGEDDNGGTIVSCAGCSSNTVNVLLAV